GNRLLDRHRSTFVPGRAEAGFVETRASEGHGAIVVPAREERKTGAKSLVAGVSHAKQAGRPHRLPLCAGDDGERVQQMKGTALIQPADPDREPLLADRPSPLVVPEIDQDAREARRRQTSPVLAEGARDSQ